MSRAALVAGVLAASLSIEAAADPLRLRADALATTASPAGLLVLETEADARAPTGTLRAEAVVWFAGNHTPGEAQSGDVLVIAVDARDRANRGRARLGRFVATLGALRATHVDGGLLRLELPRRFQAEALAGVPVVAGLGTSRSFDWIVGGRIARKVGFGGSLGIAYEQRRDRGQLHTEEVGVDAGYALSRQADVGGRLAYDLATAGIAEIMLSAGRRDDKTRTELYLVHREASHLLPANSLFSVLGDVPSQRAGTVLTWKAAPRLDVIADLGIRRIAAATEGIHDVGLDVTARTRLRLDAKGTSVLGGELRRGGVGHDAWLGARGIARIALPRDLTLAAELELVRPDVDRGRGTLWPWALCALSWRRGAWQAAIATEASASAEYRHRIDVLGQLARSLGR